MIGRKKVTMKRWQKAGTTLLALMMSVLLPGTAVLAAPQKMLDGGIFDPEYYAQQNPDVVANIGSSDTKALYAHYLYNGKAEGRLPYAPDADISALQQTSIQQADLSFILQDGTYYTYNVASDASKAQSSLLSGRPVTDEFMIQDSSLIFTGSVQEIYRDVTTGGITGYGPVQDRLTYIMPLSDSCVYTCYMQDHGTVESTKDDTIRINGTLLTSVILTVENGMVTEFCSIPLTLNE